MSAWRWTAVVAVSAALAGCVFPGESTEESPVVLGVSVGEPADPRAERVEHTFDLHVAEDDVRALGLDRSVVADHYGAFRLVTDRTVRWGESFRHCLEDDWSITEVGSGREVARVPAGRCLGTDGHHLEVDVPGRR